MVGKDVGPKVRLHDPLFSKANSNGYASLAEPESSSGKRRRKKGASKKGITSPSLPDLVDEAGTPSKSHEAVESSREVASVRVQNEQTGAEGQELRDTLGGPHVQEAAASTSEILAGLDVWAEAPERRGAAEAGWGEKKLEDDDAAAALAGTLPSPVPSPSKEQSADGKAVAEALAWARRGAAEQTLQLPVLESTESPGAGPPATDLGVAQGGDREDQQAPEVEAVAAAEGAPGLPEERLGDGGVEEKCKDEDLLVKYGVLGCATIAKKVVRGMCLARGVKAAAVASRSLYKARQFAKEMKHLAGVGPKCYESYEELLEVLRRGGNLKAYGNYDLLLEDPLVDICYIPLPTSLHVDWVTKAAAKGKHVLLEKPPALSLEDMDKILDSCGHAGVQYMDATMWLHNPRSKAIKAILEKSNIFGAVKRVTTSYSNLLEYPESNIRSNPDLDGLGALGDLGWHCVQFSLWVYDWDMPQEVVAHPGTRCNINGVITSCGATLEWEDGRLATFDCSFEEAMRQDATISSTKSVLRMSDFVVPLREDVSTFTVSTRCGLVKHGTAVGTEVKEHKVETKRPQEACMVQELARLVANIQDGIGLVDERWAGFSRKTLLVLLAVEESIRQGGAAVVIEEEKPDNSDDEYL